MSVQPNVNPRGAVEKDLERNSNTAVGTGAKTQQMKPFAPRVESHALSLATASSPFWPAPFKLFILFLLFQFFPLWFPLWFQSLWLPNLTLFLTPVTASCLCHQVPSFQMLPLAPVTFQNWWCISRRIYLLQQLKNSHSDCRHYWHGLAFRSVEGSQNV